MDFVRKSIVLDGNTFTGCTFKACRIIYKGEQRAKLVACTSDKASKWVIKGSAAKTLAFFSNLYHQGQSGRTMVEQVVFKQIKKGIRGA
jgi:hypothetical protein